MEYTLSYRDGDGWTSFFSYTPEMMAGMNNYFYSFKGGNLYRHNTNATRNNFYGTQYTTKLQGVFNQDPFSNKLFKAIAFEGNDAWDTDLDTDIQENGTIDKDWFQKKEGTYFGYVRNESVNPVSENEYPLRSINGIGNSSSSSVVGATTTINFPLTTDIKSILSNVDRLYFLSGTTPIYAGTVTNVVSNLPKGKNYIEINNAGGTAIPSQTAYFMYVKNTIAESHGVLGHYCLFNIENDSTTPIELFSIRAEVMKSNP